MIDAPRVNNRIALSEFARAMTGEAKKAGIRNKDDVTNIPWPLSLTDENESRTQAATYAEIYIAGV